MTLRSFQGFRESLENAETAAAQLVAALTGLSPMLVARVLEEIADQLKPAPRPTPELAPPPIPAIELNGHHRTLAKPLAVMIPQPKSGKIVTEIMAAHPEGMTLKDIVEKTRNRFQTMSANPDDVIRAEVYYRLRQGTLIKTPLGRIRTPHAYAVPTPSKPTTARTAGRPTSPQGVTAVVRKFLVNHSDGATVRHIVNRLENRFTTTGKDKRKMIRNTVKRLVKIGHAHNENGRITLTPPTAL